MDMIFEKIYPIDAVHLDRFGRTKPSALLLFAQETAGGHCKELAVDWDTLAAKGLFWAVIRNKMRICRLPVEGDTVTVQTWPMPATRVAFPRSTIAYDQNGNEIFRSISIWVLMDRNTRNMVLPGKSGIDVPGIVRGNELTAPGSLHPKLLENTRTRQVLFSDLDRNGHMNNTRYMDWLCDLLPSDFHAARPVRELTLCYLSEALEGETLQLNWAVDQEGILQVNAHRKNTNVAAEKDIVFSAQVLF